MTLLGGTLQTLAILAISSVVVMFLAYLVTQRDPAKAGEKTARRAAGVTAGAGATAGAAAAVGTELVLQLPELAIGLVGLGSIYFGISWQVAGAIMLVTYLVAEVANGGPRYA